MPITKYEGQKFTKGAFVLDDCYFVNCVLTDCDLFYSGGDVDWVNSTFADCRFHWRGSAAKTVQLLTVLGMLKAQSMPPPSAASSSKMMN